ncbi:MAG: hypothetical protein KME23_26210 [Goleter apudmare HA4340-LM2]|nr:hypothetical protein [Goleter apudmare HA4340-LM2]
MIHEQLVRVGNRQQRTNNVTYTEFFSKIKYESYTSPTVGLCVVIAIACWFPQSHPVTLRLIGVIGIAGCIFSIFDSFRHPEFGWLGIVARLGLIFTLWLPGSIYLLIKGRMSE